MEKKTMNEKKSFNCPRCKQEKPLEQYNDDYELCEACAFLEYDKESGTPKTMKQGEWVR